MRKSKFFHREESSTLTLQLWEFTGTALLNLFVFLFLLAYLAPLSYMIVTSIETSAQLQDSNSPVWPAEPVTFRYKGISHPVYDVPTATGMRPLALIEPHIKYSMYIDTAHPEQGLIQVPGYYLGMQRAYTPKISFANFVQLWQGVKYPHVIVNTLFVVIVGGLGVLASSIIVAYGFSRFHIPGEKYLFILLIATIMIPDSILILPSFVIFTHVLGWGASYLPLIVPQFFGNAVYIFLLRQNFKSIPRDLDEAAMLDGAGPLRILVSIILPQAIPAVVTVALLHFFNTWNELRISSLYLSTRPDLHTMAFTAQATPTFGFTPEVLQASTLFFLVVPVIVLFASQRFFMRDMVITGLEK